MNSELTNTNGCNGVSMVTAGPKGKKLAYALRHTTDAMGKMLGSKWKPVRMRLIIHADLESNKFSRVFIIFMHFIMFFYPSF